MERSNLLSFVDRLADEVYLASGRTIVKEYLTPDNIKEIWRDLSPSERIRFSEIHHLGLNRRSYEELAKEYVPVENLKIAKSVLDRVLNLAVKNGIMTLREREMEVAYRRSVSAIFNKKRITIATGLVPYSFEEIKKFLELAGDPLYKRTNKPYKGYPDWTRIASVLENEFHLKRLYYKLTKK